MLFYPIQILYLPACQSPGGPSLTEEQLESMCPSAAAIAAIVKPGMKFFDVSNGTDLSLWHCLTHSSNECLHTMYCCNLVFTLCAFFCKDHGLNPILSY